MPRKKKKTNPYISDRNPFDEVKALFSKEHGFVDVARPFMVNKILSFQGPTCPLAIKINERMNGMPKYLFNMIVNLGVPQRKKIYMNFPKRMKKENVKLRQKISETFCTDPYHSNQIIDILRRMGENPEEYFGLKEGE
jgi:hypothetical protein